MKHRFLGIRAVLARRLLKGSYLIVACKDATAREIQYAFEEGVLGAKWEDSRAICIYEDLRCMK